MINVFLCNSTDSTVFTDCCHIAIFSEQKYCPSCHKEVIHGETPSETEKIRWRNAYARSTGNRMDKLNKEMD